MAKSKIRYQFNTLVVSFLFYLLNRILSRVPFHFIRNFIYYRVIGSIGNKNSFLMGLELRNPKNIEIGNNNVFNRNVLLDGRGGKIKIGNNVDIAQETNIWTLEHDVHDDFHVSKGGDVIIEDSVWIASRVTILPGVKIGKGAVVASCSVVTKDVPPMAIVGGIPAKYIGVRKSALLFTKFHQPFFQ